MKIKGILLAAALLVASPTFAATTFSLVPDPAIVGQGSAVTVSTSQTVAFSFILDPNGDPFYTDAPGPAWGTGDTLTPSIAGSYSVLYLACTAAQCGHASQIVSVYQSSGSFSDAEAEADTWGWTHGRTSFTATSGGPTPPPDVPSFMPPPAALMASVVSGVQNTGTLIWPLFVFVGLMIAFYIANKVGDMIRESVMTRRAREKYNVGTEDEYPKKERDAIVEAVEIYDKAHPDG